MHETTTGALLGGRLTYRQFSAGHRTGFEPVLLAAAVPAKQGDLVLEAGTGAGAGLLCLAARVPGIIGIGVEIESKLATLSNLNFKNNNLHNIFTIQADAKNLPFAPQSFDHVFANPPWFSDRNTASPNAQRALAHQASTQLLPSWITSLTAVLRPKGSITLILPAASLASATACLQTHCGAITLTPLWPRAGRPAKMILISARKASKSPDQVLPGLILHDEHGISPAAQAILLDGQSINGVSNTA